MNVLSDIIAVTIVLGVIIFLHELGHFLAAKFFRVRVETFSLGFGTRLFGFRAGETDYRVSALPLGGYVKMAGEMPGELAEQAVVRPGDLASKPRWQRLVIILAGPAMNIVLAIALLVAVYMVQFPRDSVLDQPAVVASVEPGTTAAQAGLQPFDRIIAVDGVQDPTWEQVEMRAAVSEDHPLPLTIERGGRIVHATVVPTSAQQAAFGIGVIPEMPVVFIAVTPGSPAQRAGLEPGDRAIGIDGKRLGNPRELTDALQKAAGRPVTLTLLRHGRIVEKQVSAQKQKQPDGSERWMIGVELQTVRFVHLPFGQALRQSLADNRRYSTLIIDLVGRLVTHQASLKTLQGPVSIADMAGQLARQSSLVPLVGFTSMISLNLGILNLLPIPILDGGTILLLLVESLLRHDVSLRVKERIYQAGFAFLVLLMTFVIYNDIVRVVTQRHQ
ncbi:MAG TPA: RIP metalloprotease RseP [Terriglobales bacterium]|nr:RIP metalloprotease RseP [Terriglobales bacterium]